MATKLGSVGRECSGVESCRSPAERSRQGLIAETGTLPLLQFPLAVLVPLYFASMASYLDKETVRFVLLAALLAFLLQARPPQQEVDPFERPVGWFPGASRPSNRSTRALQQAAPPTLVSNLAITCGEPAGTVYVDSNGRTFVSDAPFLAPGTENRTHIADFSFTDGFTIAGASDQTLYLRERFGAIDYRFTNLENGVYVITLYEAEGWFTKPGERIFAVYINDALTAASAVDLLVQAGGARIALNLTFRQSVYDNQLDVSFQPIQDNPKVNAILLEKVGELEAAPVAPAPQVAATPASVATPDNTTAQTPVRYMSTVGINCGAPADSAPYFDAEGRKFVSDEPYFIAGTDISSFSNETVSVENTADQPLYASGRSGPMVYQFPPLENGAYWITFYDSELFFSAPGQRVFNVSINGQPTKWTFVDLVAMAGGAQKNANFGVLYLVKNHKLAVEFHPVVDWPLILAIYIQKVRELTPEEMVPTPTMAVQAPPVTVAPVTTTPPGLPTAAPQLPAPAPEIPTPTSETPTAAPELPTAAPELPTAAPELPTPAPEVSTQAPVLPKSEEAAAVDQSPAAPPAPTPQDQSAMAMTEWILNGLPISFYSTLACTAVAGPIAELFGYKTVVVIGAFARMLIQLVLLFGWPLAAAQVQYGIGAAADVILVAFLFLHVAERHFQLAASVVLAASALGVVGAAAISQLMQYFMPDVLIRWLPLGSMLFAAFVASLLPQDPVRDEMDRTKGDRPGSARLPLRGFFGREGLLSELVAVYRNQAICILSFWWIFASAVNASLLNYAPDLLTEISPDAFFNQYAINVVHILSAAGALIAIRLAAPVARTGGWAYLAGSIVVGLAAVGALLMENLGTAYISLILTAGIAEMLLCLVYAQSATLVSNGRFALLFGTNFTLALLVRGATQLALDRMGWHIGVHFFVLGLASIGGALLFGLLWTLYRCSNGRLQLVNTEDLAADYNLIGAPQDDARNRLPIYEIQDEHTWKTDDVDDDDADEGNVEMLGLVEGRPQGGVVVKDEGSLTRV